MKCSMVSTTVATPAMMSEKTLFRLSKNEKKRSMPESCIILSPDLEKARTLPFARPMTVLTFPVPDAFIIHLCRCRFRSARDLLRPNRILRNRLGTTSLGAKPVFTRSSPYFDGPTFVTFPFDVRIFLDGQNGHFSTCRVRFHDASGPAPTRRPDLISTHAQSRYGFCWHDVGCGQIFSC